MSFRLRQRRGAERGFLHTDGGRFVVRIRTGNGGRLSKMPGFSVCTSFLTSAFVAMVWDEWLSGGTDKVRRPALV